MLSLPHSVFSLLLLHTLTGVSCEDLTLDQAEQFPSEGSSVTLTYKFNKEQINDYYFYWYRQDPGKAPEFLVSVSGTGAPLSASVPGLSATVKAEERKVELQINSAAVRDSAVYYCAVRPTVTGNTTALYKNTCCCCCCPPLEGDTVQKAAHCVQHQKFCCVRLNVEAGCRDGTSAVAEFGCSCLW